MSKTSLAIQVGEFVAEGKRIEQEETEEELSDYDSKQDRRAATVECPHLASSVC